jgi:AsmA protein
MLKKIAIGVGVLLVVLIVAALVVPFLIPFDTYKAKIAEQVKAATGRDLKIDGPVRLSIIPSLALSAEKVAFSNAPGASTPDMAKLAKLQLELKLFPLISGEIVVDRFVMTEPVIALEIDERGKPNWVFDTAAVPPPAPAPAPVKPGDKPSTAASGVTALQQIRLGDVRLVNGNVTYVDRKGGARYELSDMNVGIKLPSLDAPFAFDGSLVYLKRKVALVIEAAKPRVFIEGGTTPLAIRLATDLAKFELKAETATQPQPKLDGDIDLAITSIRELAAWTGHPLTMEGSGLGPVSFKGKLAVNGTAINLREAKLSLDAIKGEGEFGVDTGGKRPAITAKLALERLDLNPYLPPEKPADKATPAAAAKPPAGAPAPAGSSDWSDDPIDAAGLHAVDAELGLKLGSLHVKKIEVGKSEVAVHLKDGNLVVELPELALYKGAGKGKLAVTPSASGPGVGLDAGFQLAGLEAEPFLKDAIDLDRLSGIGTFNVAINGRGKSQRELISALGGKGDLSFKDGAIKGINLAAMVRNIGTAFLDSGAGTPQKTDFAELGGTFTITNGILKNPDLALKSPLLRVEGTGTVDLPKRTVDYRVTPKAVASLEGQGGGAASGIMVPVLIKGPWTNLSYQPDLGGALKDQLSDPSKALDLLKGRTGGAAGGAAPGATPSAPPASTNPLDVLRGLRR